MYVNRQRCGFSLVELVLALTVLSIVVLVTIRAQVATVGLSQTSRETAAATSDLVSAMEEVLLTPAPNIPTVFPDGVPIGRFTDANLRDERLFPTYPGLVAGNPVPDPLLVRLTITWTMKRGGTRSLTLTSARTR